MCAIDEPGHDEAARGVEAAPRLDSQKHVAPLDGGRVERDDGAAGDGEAARLHHPRASRSRRSTSSASAAWSLHQLSERCASSSSTVFPCCSTHVKYFRLCHRSRLSRVPSAIQSSFCPWKTDVRSASARSRVSGPVRPARRLRTEGYRSRRVRRHRHDGVVLSEPQPARGLDRAEDVADPADAEERRETVRGLSQAASRGQEVAAHRLAHELEAQQAFLVVDAHHGVQVRHVVDPRDVLVADPLDGVPAVAVARERRALDRLEADDARPEARLQGVAGRDRARRPHGRDERGRPAGCRASRRPPRPRRR